jgi:hypothetical protein
MGDGSYLYFVRHTEIHTPVRRRHCIIHFQQPVRFVAVYLRDQRRGLSARHYRVDDGHSSRCRCIYPDSISTRLIDGNWYVCDYVVVFLHDTRCRQMERIHRPNSVEPHRGILVQRCRPSLCLYRVVFGITAKESRPASVELMSRTRRVAGRCCKPSAQQETVNEPPDIIGMRRASERTAQCLCGSFSTWSCQQQVRLCPLRTESGSKFRAFVTGRPAIVG